MVISVNVKGEPGQPAATISGADDARRGARHRAVLIVGVARLAPAAHVDYFAAVVYSV
jgi:hypothetical protein